MPRFVKQVNCPASATLAALASGALPPLARQSAALHLRSCDFCAAELRLHERAGAHESDARGSGATAPAPDVNAHAPAHELNAPPVPLALRLYAESRLAALALASRRAA